MTSTYSQAFTMDVTGGTGQGYVEFDISLSAEFFSGSPFSEYMNSYSTLSSSYFSSTFKLSQRSRRAVRQWIAISIACCPLRSTSATP